MLKILLKRKEREKYTFCFRTKIAIKLYVILSENQKTTRAIKV